MRVLLVSPTQSSNFYQSKTRAAASFGLHRLKKFIENYTSSNVQVDVLETVLDNYLEYDFSPFDIIGVSCLHPTLENDLGVLHWAKQKNSQAILVAGGIEATFVPEIIKKYSPVNYVIPGEGEKPMLDIVKTGIYDGKRNDLDEEEYRQASMAVDLGQMDWQRCWEVNKKRFGDKKKYLRIPVDSNYCPRKCLFCSSTNFFDHLKYLTAEDLVELINKAADLEPDMIMFQADNFLIGKGRQRLFELVDQLNFSSPIPLMVQVGIPDIDEKVVRAFKKLGVTKVSAGVESFSPNILKEFKKKQDENADHKSLELLLNNGFEVYSNIILTSPSATLVDVRYSVEQIKKYMEKGVEFGINLVPLKLPGSELYNMDVGWHIPERVEIPHSGGVIIEKAGKVYPNDKNIREKIMAIEEKLESTKASAESLSELIIKHFM